MYVADLRPLGEKAAEMVRKDSQQALSVFAKGLPLPSKVDLSLKNMTQSVTSETRDGREVKVVTFAGDKDHEGKVVRERYVYEIDATSKRMLSFKRYASIPGVKEELVGASEKIEFDVPMPADVRPRADPVIPATLRIEETATTLKMIMSAEGQDTGWVCEVPK